jgi:hypothetical protein
MNLREMRGKVVEWIDLAPENDKCRAHVNTVKNFGFIQYGEFIDKLRKCV